MTRWFIFTDFKRRRVMAPAVALLAAAASAGCTIGPTSPDPTPPQAVAPFTATRKAPENTKPAVTVGLAASFADLKKQLPGTVGVAVVPIGGAGGQVFGDWNTGVSWSTAKVPLAIAYVRETGQVTDQVRASIIESDNAAAEHIWSELGEPATAAVKVVAVLRDGGDNETVVQDQRTRSEYSAFGQTVWSLRNQALFTANLPCIARGPEVLDLMSDIQPAQRWGLSNVDGAQFKGGWGPGVDGKYLVRQLGIVSVPGGGKVAVAMAATPNSGTFDDGVQMLDQVGAWIKDHIADLSGGAC
ncbi:hypothetical protein [Smaragdicoccus niigatensis]|uniref:hypothetical protein n=2 Tax=Smaragdicoccus niigatensis TaxID=359359 RepID=UPI0039EE867C